MLIVFHLQIKFCLRHRLIHHHVIWSIFIYINPTIYRDQRTAVLRRWFSAIVTGALRVLRRGVESTSFVQRSSTETAMPSTFTGRGGTRASYAPSSGARSGRLFGCAWSLSRQQRARLTQASSVRGLRHDVPVTITQPRLRLWLL